MDHNITLWKLDSVTHEFRKKVQQKIRDIEVELGSGSLLLKDNDQIVKEYTFNVGVLEGLKYLDNYVEVESESGVESTSVSWSNASQNY